MSDRDRGPWITFRSLDEEYALDVYDVVEILGPRTTTPLPGAASHVAGIASWRGRTIPVIDLASRLKAGSRTPEGRKGMIVLRGPEPFALRVDAPGRILGCDLPGGGEAPPDGPTLETREDGVRVVRWKGGLMRILDPRSILGNEPLVRPRETGQEECA